MKTVFLFIFICLSTSFSAFSQKKVKVMVVHFHTDSIIRGEIIKNIPGSGVSLKTLDNQHHFIGIDEIDRITSEVIILSNNPDFPDGNDSIVRDILPSSQESEIYQIIESKTPKRGVYKYYHEFRANEPSITDSFYVKKTPRPYYLWQDTPSLEPRYVRKNKKVKGVWGFSDGENIYICKKKEFFQIVIENDDLIFYGFDKVDKSSVLPAYFMTGVVGASISDAAAVSNARSQKIRYTIHPSKGTSIHPIEKLFPEKSNSKNLEPSNELIVYRKWKDELDVQANFLVDGVDEYSFEKNSYVYLKYPLSQISTRICTGPGFEDCTLVVFASSGPTFVKCSYPMVLILHKSFFLIDSKVNTTTST